MKLLIPRHHVLEAQIAMWAEDRLGQKIPWPYRALGMVTESGGHGDVPLQGAVILTNYIGSNVDITVVGRGWTPNVIRGICGYIFNELGCIRATLHTRKSNDRAKRILSRHFKFEAVCRNWFGDEDAVQYRMLRNECPWLPEETSNEQPFAAASA